MADLVITATNVVAGEGAEIVNGAFGATVTAGQLVYRDEADGDKFKLYDADSATAAARELFGVALNSGSTNQRASIQRGGTISIGATVAVGRIYVGSDTPGGIAPSVDLDAGDFVSIVGIGISVSQIRLAINNSGVAFV